MILNNFHFKELLNRIFSINFIFFLKLLYKFIYCFLTTFLIYNNNIIYIKKN